MSWILRSAERREPENRRNGETGKGGNGETAKRRYGEAGKGQTEKVKKRGAGEAANRRNGDTGKRGTGTPGEWPIGIEQYKHVEVERVITSVDIAARRGVALASC